MKFKTTLVIEWEKIPLDKDSFDINDAVAQHVFECFSNSVTTNAVDDKRGPKVIWGATHHPEVNQIHQELDSKK